jgi:hypothetical protein
MQPLPQAAPLTFRRPLNTLRRVLTWVRQGHPFLRIYEAILFELLTRSKRIGAVIVLDTYAHVGWVVGRNREQVRVAALDPDEDSETAEPRTSEAEPPSMLLERLFHAPDAEKTDER